MAKYTANTHGEKSDNGEPLRFAHPFTTSTPQKQLDGELRPRADPFRNLAQPQAVAVSYYALAGFRTLR
jgi:hypothetical protein